MARGGEELGIIWHRMGTWQGRMTRYSHDVAAVKNQEERGTDGIGLEGERDVTMIVSILLLLFFSNISMFSKIHEHYLPAAEGQDIPILSCLLFCWVV